MRNRTRKDRYACREGGLEIVNLRLCDRVAEMRNAPYSGAIMVVDCINRRECERSATTLGCPSSNVGS